MRSFRICLLFPLGLIALLLLAADNQQPPQLQAGVASIDITPTEPIRLAGYSSRNVPHESVAQQLQAKALVIEDAENLSVLLTVDTIGVPAWVSHELSKRLEAKVGLPRGQLAVASTHSHTSPALDGCLPFMFRSGLTDDERATIKRYTNELLDKLEKISLEAIEARKPAQISWSKGEVDFAINRRALENGKWKGFGHQEDGPVDHSLPMMRVSDADGKLKAVLVNYACHCTTLGGKFNQVHGDWAGVAREEIEKRHPGVTAMIAIGCGADANPGPRSDELEVVQGHGTAVADEVDRLLGAESKPITSAPSGVYREIELVFDPPAAREVWEQKVANDDPDHLYYEAMLERLDAGQLEESAMYPIQTWTFGDDLAMVFLAGEVVVDYAQRFYREYDADRLWINAYANDVPFYVASRRLYDEDGYEVDRSMVYYGKPSRLAPDTEERVASEVMKQIPQTFYSEETLQLLPLPTAKEDAVSTISVADDLVVELVAAEPLVQDPVDIAWDYEGRLWVVEMADYPLGVDGKPGGRVRYLEDEDGDGFYDKSTVFLDGLAYPNSVMPWRDGVLVTTANGIFLAREGSKEPIIEGLPAANPQHQLGGLQWGLDGWVHSANELRGGGREIKSAITGKTLNLSSGDLRFHPDTGEFALRSGRTQFGLNRDDWGNWFGSSNSRPWWHCPLEQRYLSRNPDVAYPSPYVYLGDPPSAGPVYPTSKALKRFNDYDKVNRITSACNVAPYRETLLGEEASRSLFVAEPVHNLVTRIVLEPNGATFSGKRAESEQDSEFFASTDNWCRPTSIRTGPDGALYIVDMYRLVIEHPEWIPDMWQRRLNLRAGHDKGRIYRVRPKDRQLREFAPTLESENGIQRDLAHQQHAWNGEDHFADLVQNGKTPQTRLQALAASSLNDDVLKIALKDEHSSVRRLAVRKSEGRAALLPEILALAEDDDAFVRQQVAFSLGEFTDQSAGMKLATMLVANRADPYITAAVLSSAKNHIGSIVNHLGASFLQLPTEIVSGLARTDKAETSAALTEALLGDGALADKLRLAPFADRGKLGPLFEEARALAANEDATPNERVVAIGALGAGDSKLVFELLDSKQPQAVQSAALQRISNAQQLLDTFPDLGSQTRSEALGLFVSRSSWTPLLLDQPDLVRRLDPTQRASLTNHRDAKIRERAQSLFKPDETAVESLKRLEPSLTLDGNRENGRQLFVGLCSTCHKLDDAGFHVGPDLAALTNKSREALLLAIADPNQAMEDKYAMVNAETKDGSALAGVVTAESETSITVLSPGGQSQTVPRSDLKSVTNSGISMMPRGLEAALQPQQMADLLVYLQTAGDSAGIRPGEDGAIRLTAKNGLPRGGVAFDPRLNALSKIESDDSITWNVDTIPAGNYSIFFSVGKAVSGEAPRSPFELSIGDHVIRGDVDAGSLTGLRKRQFSEFRVDEQLTNVAITFRHHFPEGQVAISEIVLAP